MCINNTQCLTAVSDQCMPCCCHWKGAKGTVEVFVCEHGRLPAWQRGKAVSGKPSQLYNRGTDSVYVRACACMCACVRARVCMCVCVYPIHTVLLQSLYSTLHTKLIYTVLSLYPNKECTHCMNASQLGVQTLRQTHTHTHM